MAEIICKSCQKKVNVGDIRADKSGSGWICVNCYKTQHPKVYGNIDKKGSTIKTLIKPQRMKYYCRDCGYKFENVMGFRGRCPYCNRYSVREERDAETLIKEAVQDEEMGFTKSRLRILEDL